MNNERNSRLTLTPMMWINSGPTNHIEANIARFEVEGVAGAYVDRASDGEWLFETALQGCAPVQSESRFNSAPEAAIALEACLGDCLAA